MVELMIAIGVLMVAVMTAFSSQLTSASLIRTSQETNIAMADLQACMEQVLLMRTDDLPVSGSLYEVNVPIAAYSSLNLENETIIPTYGSFDIGETVPDPLEILLTMTWNDHGGRQRSLTLSSLKVR